MVTNNKIILVSFIDQTQKDFSLPGGVYWIGRSLNVMINSTPYLITTTNDFDNWLFLDLEKKYPNRIYSIGEDR